LCQFLAFPDRDIRLITVQTLHEKSAGLAEQKQQNRKETADFAVKF
jgi:hypothetical protein